LALSSLAESFLTASSDHRESLKTRRLQERQSERRKNGLRLLAVVLGIGLLIMVGWMSYRAWYRLRAEWINEPIPFGVTTADLGEIGSNLEWVAPLRQVHLPAFQMEVHEVTNAQYCWCRRAGGCSSDPAYGETQVCDPAIAQEPVSNVILAQADQYCRWLGRRLPTEIEWEWAARGPQNRIYPTGKNTPLPGEVNIWDQKGRPGGKWPVDRPSKDITDEGLLGMAGNVREWTLSLRLKYDDPAYLQSFWPDLVTASDGFSIARGGSFRTGPDSARSLSRYPIAPDQSVSDLGFRCVQGVSLSSLQKEMYFLP
jgi:formylglycine-generating enzyme required for sulfatase activity